MPSCFIICPIGDSGTETRRNADDLRDLIIKPTLEPFGFQVDRGDHHSEQGKIDNDVIRSVQEADLCIVDISLPNPNVYYELGRRDETGKPFILLRSVGSDEIPVDIATCRYVEYDLDSRRGIIDACAQLKAFVEPIVKRGFESSGSGASLGEIAEILKRLERKVDRLKQSSSSGIPSGTVDTSGTDTPSNVDPYDLLELAQRQKNIPMAEKAMDMLRYRMQQHKWLDRVVERVAIMGSIKAGDVLIEHAMEFMDDNRATFHEKVEYFACLVGNLMKTDRESDYRELAEQIFVSLEANSTNESDNDRMTLYNQLNRLYYGLYSNTSDKLWLDKAIHALETALQIGQRSFLYFNLSICEKERNNAGDMEHAIEHALRCVQLDGETQDDDHLEHVCKLLYKVDDPRLSDYLDLLAGVNSIKAQLLRSKWNM